MTDTDISVLAEDIASCFTPDSVGGGQPNGLGLYYFPPAGLAEKNNAVFGCVGNKAPSFANSFVVVVASLSPPADAVLVSLCEG